MEPVSDQERRTLPPVFVSYATADRTEALKICKSIERRGVACWISCRDVPPGANYQEAIVQAIRDAGAVVLLFSAAANDSDEIKKELSLASHHHVPVIALRIQDIAPSDAFAYELSTRQWIDAFKGREKAIDALAARIRQITGTESGGQPSALAGPGRRGSSRSLAAIAAAACLALAIMAGAWWWLRPAPVAAHSMMVRLAGFQLLSADLPANTPAIVDAEINAAFNADGVVGVSTASAPPPGTAPAYALGGTIQREGQSIRVITHLTNERSGATLWTDTFDYDGKEADKVPRHIAVDAGNVVRCGLFGASTYDKVLPDPVLKDYMQFCQGHWDTDLSEGRKALIPAQRVVAAVPDFSWGWAAVAGAYWKVAMTADSERLADEARASGRQAADRGVAIDGRNSEALYIKAMLVDWNDWIGRDALFQRALAARRLDCGCERHQYGWLLANVGRMSEALDQLRQANDMLALYVYTPFTLAEALVAAGRPGEAKPYYDAAIELAPSAGLRQSLSTRAALAMADEKALADPELPLPDNLRAALLSGLRAQSSGDAATKAKAVQLLLALPAEQRGDFVVRLLAGLGATEDAFRIASRLAERENDGPAIFWHPVMRQVRSEPGFPALVARLGLVNYWKTTRTKPDVCGEAGAPTFCSTI